MVRVSWSSHDAQLALLSRTGLYGFQSVTSSVRIRKTFTGACNVGFLSNL
jgi:hypothetical protein